jgi:hypothetical protein
MPVDALVVPLRYSRDFGEAMGLKGQKFSFRFVA